MLTGEMKSACQIRTLYGLPCERCKYGAECSAYQNKLKEGKENEQKKQRKRSRRKESRDNQP